MLSPRSISPIVAAALALGLGIGLGLGLAGGTAVGASSGSAPHPTYHIVAVELGLGRIKVGDENIATGAKTLDDALTDFAKSRDARIIDVYTLGSFGPFFVFESAGK